MKSKVLNLKEVRKWRKIHREQFRQIKSKLQKREFTLNHIDQMLAKYVPWARFGSHPVFVWPVD